MRKYLLMIGLLIITLVLWYLIRLHKDNALPGLRYFPSVDSLRVANGSTLFYFAKLDTTINKDTIVIAVYGRLPVLIFNRKEKFGTFEKAHVKTIGIPRNIKYLRFENELRALDSLISK